jgi:hypothetical protein
LLCRICPEILGDKSLWLELLSKGDGHDYVPYIPEPFLHDYDIVDAQLRSSRQFPKSFIKLPVDTQLRFKHLLVERMGECVRWTSHFRSELLWIPDVALAAILAGWGHSDPEFSDVLKSAPWSKDPAFLLSVSTATSTHKYGYFWECCTKGLLHDDAFLSKVLVGCHNTTVPPDHRHDFFVMCAVRVLRISTCSCISLLEDEGALAREARKRFATYVALETFMEGVQARPGSRLDRPDRVPSSPVVLLSQDRYTMQAIKGHLKEYLGAPSDAEFVLIRKVCNKFARHGY